MSYKSFIRVLAAPLSVLYLLAVVGFDIHICGDNCRTYVESLLCDVTCQALHPETPCHCHGCEECGHCVHHCESDYCNHFDERECCTDVIGVLTVCTDEQQIAVVPQCPVMVVSFHTLVQQSAVMSVGEHAAYSLDAGTPPDAYFDSLCILRA